MGVFAVSTIDKGEIVIGSDNKGTLTLRLLARCTSPDDSLSALRFGLPQYQKWQRHQFEPTMFVDQFRATQHQHTSNWECQVDYIDTILKDPLSKPAVIGEVRTSTLPGATLTDYQGNAILNTAGEPPEPFDFPEQVITFAISKNVAGLPGWLFNFESCINADSVKIGGIPCDPLTLMIRTVALSAEQEHGDVTYRTATCELWRRPSKWLELWPSRGFNESVKIWRGTVANGQIASADGFYNRPILINGEKPSEPQFLDKKGKWLRNPTPGQLWIIKTQLYPSINFTNYFPLQ